MTLTYKVSSVQETENIGFGLAALLDKHGVNRAFVALFGEMGVGKTAFSRGFASFHDIKNVKSPTYTIVNEYRGKIKLHHFDFYRIKDGDDLYSIGYDDIIEDDGVCLGEWSENVIDFLPENHVSVTIVREGGNEDAGREIKIEIPFISE